MPDMLRKSVLRTVRDKLGNDLADHIEGAVEVRIQTPSDNSTLLLVYTNKDRPPRWFEVHVKEMM